jgi:hypothetical protein
MTSRYLAATLLLCACACNNGGRQTTPNENTQHPGTVRFSNITPTDSVFLDGEEVLAAGLARSGNELLLAPGTYLLRVTTVDGLTCESRLVVRAGQVSSPAACVPHAKS